MPIFDEKIRGHIYHPYLTSILWIQPIIKDNFINIANVKNKDISPDISNKDNSTDVSPAQSSGSLIKFLEKTEFASDAMRKFWGELQKLQIILTVPWEKRYLEGSKGASKEKAYIARKMS